jgi:hypothetical protein
MILRWVLHVEAHWGYRPIIKFRRAPRTGDVTPWGVLVLCPTCQDGHLAHDPRHNLTNPMPSIGLPT